MDENRKNELCTEILKYSCHKVFLELRFLEQALFRLMPEEKDAIFFGSDGDKLYYDRKYLLNRYLQSPEAVACDYLHTVIHCLYQHPFLTAEQDERYWNLAADIAVADVLREIDVPWITGEISQECFKFLAQIKKQVPLMSAPHISEYLQSEFKQNEELCGYEYGTLERLFQRDSHVCWDQGQKEEGGSIAQIQKLSNEWKETAENVALNAESFSITRGKMPESMRIAIQRVTREQYDYGEFLRKFAVMNESMKVDTDEFDYIYYLYGLQILKKVPLIEPLEYKEEKQIKEFVIVIDTSGSCSEELVQRFLNKTYSILCQTEHFSDRIVLHIIQCDAMVQEDVQIDSLENMEEYISHMEIKGCGGTDFRPAFTYVDELCKNGEFKKLCGLIYFTDGYGVFPHKPPDYKTAFVFVERDDDVKVPPWAMRLYLDHV